MKNTILILILALTFFTSSCKTHKVVTKEQIHTVVDSVVNNDIKIIDQVKENVQIDLTVTERIVQSDFTEETVTITEYSSPDSTDQQHVIKTTMIFRKNDIKTDTQTDSKLIDTSTIEQNIEITDNSVIDLNKDITKKTITTEKSKDRTWIVLIIIMSAIWIVGYLIWKFYPR